MPRDPKLHALVIQYGTLDPVNVEADYVKSRQLDRAIIRLGYSCLYPFEPLSELRDYELDDMRMFERENI